MPDILAKLREDLTLNNYSQRSIDLYPSVCARYLDFVGDDRPIEETGADEIRAWVQRLRVVEQLKPRTCNSYVSMVLFMYELSVFSDNSYCTKPLRGSLTRCSPIAT